MNKGAKIYLIFKYLIHPSELYMVYVICNYNLPTTTKRLSDDLAFFFLSIG